SLHADQLVDAVEPGPPANMAKELVVHVHDHGDVSEQPPSRVDGDGPGGAERGNLNPRPRPEANIRSERACDMPKGTAVSAPQGVLHLRAAGELGRLFLRRRELV